MRWRPARAAAGNCLRRQGFGARRPPISPPRPSEGKVICVGSEHDTLPEQLNIRIVPRFY